MGHEPHFPKNLDSTIMACFDTCETKFYQEYCLRLAPNAISPHLHAGGAIAYGCEIVRKAVYIDGLSTREALIRGTNAFMEFWGLDEDAPFVHEKNPKTFNNTLGALWDYFYTYDPVTDPIQPIRGADGKPAIEFSFGIPMEVNHPETGDPILYAGRFDMLGNYNGNMPCVLDEKTATSLSAGWANQWAMRGQFLGYCFAAQKYGYECSTAVVRGLAIQKTQYKHLQAIVQFNNFHIERWWEQINMRAQRAVDAWNSGKWFMSFGDGCGAYGGCEYMELCVSPDPTTWYGDYAERLWDPLNRNPTATEEVEDHGQNTEWSDEKRKRFGEKGTLTPEQESTRKESRGQDSRVEVEEIESNWDEWTSGLTTLPRS